MSFFPLKPLTDTNQCAPPINLRFPCSSTGCCVMIHFEIIVKVYGIIIWLWSNLWISNMIENYGCPSGIINLIAGKAPANLPQSIERNISNPRSCARLVRNTLCLSNPRAIWPVDTRRLLRFIFNFCSTAQKEKLCPWKLFLSLALLVSIKNDFNDADNYEKYGHPRQSNVVERNCALERVPTQLGAIRVVLIPIDAWRVCRWV